MVAGNLERAVLGVSRHTHTAESAPLLVLPDDGGPWAGKDGTMDVFAFRQHVIADYERFSRSFSRIRADDIAQFLDAAYQAEHFWPAPLVQLNPNFVPGGTIAY